MNLFKRQIYIILLAAVMAIAAPGVSHAQLGALREKAIETLTNGVMKELEKKFTEIVAKETISAAAKEYVVKNLCEMSRPIVKKFVDSAASGKLPNQAELVNSVLKDIVPRVPDLIAASAMEGAAGSVAQVAGQTTAVGQAAAAVNAALPNALVYDDEKDFTVETINNGNGARITRYNGKNTELKIPPRIGNRPVTEIGDRAFTKKGLTSVVIPESVIFIGNFAFADNPIGNVSIGANVYIANNAFESANYNSFSADFYNSQGRKAATYNNNWRIAGAPIVPAVAIAAATTATATTTTGVAVQLTQPAQPAQPAVVKEVPIPKNMALINGGTIPTKESITVSSFYIWKYEITQKEYREVMGKKPSYRKGDKLPVEQVSWYDAIEYCNKLSSKSGLTPAYTINGEEVIWNRSANGYRLPTSAEWEYACRAGTTTYFNTGNDINNRQANISDEISQIQYSGKTKAVGSYKPNAWGLYDMHGNVDEWCWDWYDETLPSGIDPIGPVTGTRRVIRGGYYDTNKRNELFSSTRRSASPTSRVLPIGFRIVRNAK